MANPYFNAAYYWANNPDVYAAGFNSAETAEQHYLLYGASEAFQDINVDRKPAPWFDIQYYFQTYPDLQAAGVTPADAFHHFTTYGIAEGRSPAAGIDITEDALSDYAAGNPDLVEAFGIVDPEDLTDAEATLLAQHFYQYGYNEDRPNSPFDLTPTPEAITLTTGVDSGPDFTGTVADDVFNASLGEALGGLAGQQTLQGFDVLDGGEGHDELNAELNFLSAVLGGNNPTITNIEQYNLTVSGSSLVPGVGYLDLSRANGYEVLQNIDSRGDLTLENVNLMDDGNAPEILLTNVRGDTEIGYDSDVSAISEQNVTASEVGRANAYADLSIYLDGASGSGSAIETLNLNVSNGVYLNLYDDAEDIQNLAITGSGLLGLTGDNDFGSLETLDSTEYTGNLSLDVSGSTVLESVETGTGNDRVVVDNDAVRNDEEDGSLSVDMGEGENTLAVAGVLGTTTLSNLDFTGGVENVQTLEFTEHLKLWNTADPSLDLAGFDDKLGTVLFSNGLDGNSNELTLTSPNADLTLASNGSFDDVDLHTEGISNLTVDVAGGNLDIDQLAGADLETLTLTQTADPLVFSYSALDIVSDAANDVSNLQTITSTATGYASVEIDATDVDADLGSLTSVNVTSTNGDATLNLTGRAGSAAVAGVRQVEQFTVTVGNSGTQAGNIIFSSGDLDGGALATNYSASSGVFASRSDYAAEDVAQNLDASTQLNASVPTYTIPFVGTFPSDNIVTVEWADFGAKEQLNVISTSTTSGTINTPTTGLTTLVTAGVTPEAMVAGNGFEALETATVVAENGDADVDLTDVYGAVVLDVTAGDDVSINLDNTEVTTITATAVNADDTVVNHVDINVEGDTVGNSALTTITVTSDTAAISLADDLSSFETLDVSNVTTDVYVDASAADFGSAIVYYLVGATADVEIDSNIAAAEWFSFIGDDIGDVVISGFEVGNGANHDIIDLSSFGITQISELTIVDGGAGAEITAGAFDGTIELTGITASDVEAGNFYFA